MASENNSNGFQEQWSHSEIVLNHVLSQTCQILGLPSNESPTRVQYIYVANQLISLLGDNCVRIELICATKNLVI